MGIGTTGKAQPEPLPQGSALVRWLPLACLLLLIAAGTAVAYFAAMERLSSALSFLSGAAAASILLILPRLLALRRATPQFKITASENSLKEILESAGPAIVSIGLDGKFKYMNSAAERLLGYHADELMDELSTTDILAPGEGARLVTELQKIAGIQRPVENTPAGRMAAYLDCVRTLPPSMVPSFNAQLRHKEGALLPVMLHMSALRESGGELAGLVAVAVDQSAIIRQEQAQRESQERYRDLFESSSEMIATLSPAGRFLYANPAWKRCFGLENAALMALESFEDLFASGCQAEAAALFHRVLEGESIDRAPLRHHTRDGRVLELELSLSQRQKAGNPLAVRCLLRDVTQQKQRENRLALQLVVSQIVGENSSPEVAAMRILEALCVAQGWDVAIHWGVNQSENRLEFRTAWGVPGRRTETIIQEAMGLTVASGSDLAGEAWKERRPIWISDLSLGNASPRIQSALRQEMVSGWAVPVRAGSKILAVLEFYCHFTLREDPEAIATIETAATSLGQLVARSQEQGRAEELYRQQETLLNSVADGICGVDRAGRISFVNPAAGRLLGEAPVDLIGKKIHEVLHGNAEGSRRCGEDCALQIACDRQKSTIGEDTIFRADGRYFPAEYSLTPIIDQGRFSGSVLSFHDISQRYALDRLKDEFISTVSHELRTPLTSIRGALGLLSSGMLGEINEKAANLLRIALTNSDRLVRLINDILDLERIQSGREPLVFRPVQLAEIVRQAIEGMAPVAESAGVQLIHDSVQTEISADSDRLLQVLTNLLSNAIKFSSPNSSVSVMLRPGVTGVTLSVIDHGRGIPADKLEVIFGRFQQVDASDSRQKGGSGLGLAICRTIILQHSGRIWAERNSVRGSTFRVFLPYKPVPHEPVQESFESVQGEGTVVLASTDPAARKRIAEQLNRHGYTVVETASMEQTLVAAHQGVAAILLDTSLDGMNGWEILPLLRHLDPEARTPVVLLSVETSSNPGELPSGAEGWVPKPVQEDTLLGELARVLCGPGEKARILIVEDDHDLARVISEVFSREGISVQVAHTLQEAIDACFTFGPHLLVLDIGLPDGDGFNVVDWLRQHESLARLPLVVYSGREVSLIERRQLTLGPTHFLTKARVQPQQLEALVLTMLRSSRQTDEATSEPSRIEDH